MAITKHEYAGTYTGHGYSNTDYAVTLFVSDAVVDQAHTILWICSPGAGEYTNPKSSPPLLVNGVGLQFVNNVLPETETINGVTVKFLYAAVEYNQYDDAAGQTNLYLNYIIPSLGFTYNNNGCVGSGLSLGGRLANYWCDGNFIPTTKLYSFCTFDGATDEFTTAANAARVNSYISSITLTHNQNDPTVNYATPTNSYSAIKAVNSSFDIILIPGPNPGQHDSWTQGYLNSNTAPMGTVNYNVYKVQATKFLQNANLTVSTFTAPTIVTSVNQTINLPTSNVSLTSVATVTQSGATIASYFWSRTSGPASSVITTPNGQNTTVTGLTIAGTYIFNVIATDSNNQTVTSSITITVSPATVTPPVSNPGGPYTVNPLPYSVTLNGSSSTAPGSTITNYTWAQVSGPNGSSIQTANTANTLVSGLIVGSYVFSLTVVNALGTTSTNNATVTVNTVTVIVNPDTSPNANQNVPIDNIGWLSGSNLGYYQNSAGGTGFSNTQLSTIAASIGLKSFRVTLNDNYLSANGLSSLIIDHAGYQANGMLETSAITGNAAISHCEVDANGNRIVYPGCAYPSNMFNGIYNAIWTDQANGIVNPANLAAKFFHDVVVTYGPYIKYWEVENEPDFTYATANAFANSSGANNWYTNPPPASSLPNLNCPPNYYVRELRIFYEVLKKLYPNSYVCTGGLGYVSFLDFVLRSTDHPTDGTIKNSTYPLTGGAYFDCLSFHSYPFYGGGRYYTNGAFVYFNDSDAFLNQLISDVSNWQILLTQYGYDGINLPKKKMIITEHNIPGFPISGNGNVGGIDIQSDYIFKSTAMLQKAGLSQGYVFNLGNAATGPAAVGANPFDYMGFFDNLRTSSFGNQQINSQGFAQLTYSLLLSGYAYDPVKSGNLALPATINGAAFTKNNVTRYMLWAVSQDPGTVAASQYDIAYAEYSLPGVTGNVTQVWRDYSKTGYSKTVPATVIPLTAKPSVILISGDILPVVTPVVFRSNSLLPVFNATIYVEQPLQNVLLDGSLSTSPTAQILSYTWVKVSGPTGDTIVDPNSPQTIVKIVTAGTYVYSLTITN